MCTINTDCYYPGATYYCCKNKMCAYTYSSCPNTIAACTSDYGCFGKGSSEYCCRKGSCYLGGTSCQITYCSANSDCSWPGITQNYCCKSGFCYYGTSSCPSAPSTNDYCNLNSDCSKLGSNTYCCINNKCQYTTSSCSVSRSCASDSTCYYNGVTGSYCCKEGLCAYSSACIKTGFELPGEIISGKANATLGVAVVYFIVSIVVTLITCGLTLYKSDVIADSQMSADNQQGLRQPIPAPLSSVYGNSLSQQYVDGVQEKDLKPGMPIVRPMQNMNQVPAMINPYSGSVPPVGQPVMGMPMQGIPGMPPMSRPPPTYIPDNMQAPMPGIPMSNIPPTTYDPDAKPK